ncbi:MAG TPA: hypothetical protein VH593_12180 [Ktedonobacteraceae bacterium]|jgi:hypothetical protein
MVSQETRQRLRNQLIRRRERELKLRKDFYTLEEVSKKLSISIATLWKHLKDPSLQIEKFDTGPRKTRLIASDDIRKIWWRRNTIRFYSNEIPELTELPTDEHKAVKRAS